MTIRSLLSDLNLKPESCEMITVEPGHILSEDQRIPEIRGYDDGYSIQERSHYYEQLKGRAKLRSSDHTGKLRLSWQVEVGDDSMDLSMSLNSEKTGFEVRGSLYQVAKESWKLHYGDRSIGCIHEEERVGTLAEGETLDVFSAGAMPGKYSSPQWKPLVLLSAHGNDRGQIACLMSAKVGWHGMVKREACLRCCVTYCLKMGLDFLID